MQNKIYKKYVTFEEKFKEMEAKRKELREALVDQMKKDKIEKMETEFGSFTVCKKVTWVYSSVIKQLEESLKIKKIKEQEKEIAEKSESEYLLFKPQ